VCWAIKCGVPFDVAHALEDWELLGYAVVFAQFENGNKEYDWEVMEFIDENR
jgi:hypothetical protein